jgi:hypothetical protein
VSRLWAVLVMITGVVIDYRRLVGELVRRVRTSGTSRTVGCGGRVEDPHGVEDRNAPCVLFIHEVQNLHAGARVPGGHCRQMAHNGRRPLALRQDGRRGGCRTANSRLY